MRCVIITMCVAAVVAGCRGEPAILCDRERLFVALDDVELGISDDVDPATPGVQIDLVVNSTLGPGRLGFLFITDAQGNEQQFNTSPTISDAEGLFLFQGVTLPTGLIELNVRSASGCRLVESTRELFVFDEMGVPSCLVSLATLPVDRELIDDPVLAITADDDLLTDDLQTTIRVDTGRDDVDITLFVRDVDTGDEQQFDEAAGQDAAAEFPVTLPQGRVALRAICIWSLVPEQPVPSATLPLFVDTIAPVCSVTAPTAAVVAGDDLDGDLGNGIQFLLDGLVDGGDAKGADAQFEVNGEVVTSSSVAEDGATAATGTLPNPPPSPQTFTLFGEDRAGNTCTDTVSF